MAVVKANAEDIKLLARLMRAEAEEDGRLGMLMVGNTGINRIVSNCLDFNGLRTIPNMVYQSPGGFEAVRLPYFYQRARDSEIGLAKQVIKGWKYHPGSYALWFFKPEGSCPATWFGRPNTGRFKSHCFYRPYQNECPRVFW